MKTLRTIAAVLVAAFLVFGPAMAFAQGETVTVQTNASSYSGTTGIQVSGTVSPAPSVSNTAVAITTTGPAGVVDIGEANVATSTGQFQYTIVPGSTMWVTGTYTINATYGGPGGTGSATTKFSYTSAVGVQIVTVTTTVTTTTAVSTATVTTTVPSSDAAALTSIQSSLSGISTTLSVISTAITGITSSVSSLTTAVNGLTSSVNTISTGVTGITSALSPLSTAITGLSGLPAQVTNTTNAVNNNQTYVLVVAALAAITLVLELAILVRKLS